MVYYRGYCPGPESTLSYGGMSVLVRALWIKAVVYVDSLKIIKAYDPVKFLRDTVEIILYIISSVAYVARIETYSYFLLYFTLSIIAFSSSKVPPISLPFPAMVSRSITVL